MFLLEESIKLLWKLIEEGKANKEHTNKQQHEFLKVASKAVRRTLSYIRDENKRDTKTEEELSELWANVALAARPFDSDLAERCYLKGNYWANPNNWSDEEVKNAGIEIERIETEIRNHFKGKSRAKKSKQQKTIEKPAKLPKEELSKPKENNQKFGHGTIRTHKPWYKKIWAIVAGIIIFLAALTTLILNLDRIKEKIPQNDANKTTTETKTDKKVEDITLLYLFKNDFNNLLRKDEDIIFTYKDGLQTTVKSRLYLDFESQTKFVGFYIPSIPETFDICTHLVEDYKIALELTKKIEHSAIGLQPVNTSELKFSGRVFIYHEYPLFEAQKRELLTLYQKHDLSPQFRGTDYLFKKKEIEKSH